MQEAENIKPAVTRLLERYAGALHGLVLLLTAGIWFLTGSTAAMLAVLVASCPCALVLAAPATSIAAIAVASRHGILVKGAAFLEQLADCRCGGVRQDRHRDASANCSWWHRAAARHRAC